MNPLVSVIIPCFNQDNYIIETLQSVLNQTYTNWECLIIDDGSTDNSANNISEFVATDNRFVVMYKNNGGVSSARNLGLDKAKGKFIQFLDADDILEKNKIQYSINELTKVENKDVRIVISNFEMISHDSKVLEPPFCVLKEEFLNLDGFLKQWNILFSVQIQCGFFKSSLFDAVRFPEMLSAQEDWVVWVHLFKINNECVFINRALAYYRKNPQGRMITLGIDDNQLKAVACFRGILSYEEFYHFSSNLISKYYHSDIKFRNKLTEIKHSNTYQAGLIIKKGFRSIGVLKLSRKIIKLILKFKRREKHL